ncbi:MAG: lysylphosphatidylglycerol synthase domain-containing protein [Thermomicrobiales bacterium]
MSTEGVETFPFEDGDGAADPSPGGWREQVRETLARSIAGAKRVNIAVWMTLFLGLAAFFLYRERRELVDIGHVLRTANPLWLLAGLLVEVVIQLLFAAKHVQLFRMLGKRVPIGPVTEANLQRHLFSTLVPAGGPPSVLLLIRKLSRYGVTADDIVLVTVLFSVLGHTSFAIFLLPVVGWLVIHHNASSLVLFGTVALVVIVLLMFGALMLLLGGIRVPGQVEARIPRRARVFVDQARSHGITPRRLAPPLLFAIGVDVFGAVLLWASLRAVGVHSSIAVAAAGYAVGTLFLLLAPVFQGIGVVELSMAVSLQRLGVSKVEALGATVLYRVGELWLPLLVAVAIQERTRKGARAAPALFPALLTGVTGLLSVLSVLAPSIPRRMNRLQAYSRFAPADASRTFTLVAGFLLIFLSYSLLRRKRVAWIVAMGVLSGALVTHLGKRHDYVVAIVAAVNLASLWVYRRRFRVRSDLPTIRQGLIQFAGSVSFALAYGTLGFWLLDERDFGISFSL